MAAKDPLVSIITPIFNREEYLPATIESVLRQDFTDWELIMIDDGSTGGVREVAESYCRKDARIFYRHQENRGTSAARNRGIAMARGRYLAFLDSDDCYLQHGLATLVSAMQAAPAAVKLVYGDFLKYFQAEKRSVHTRTSLPLTRPRLYFQFLIPGKNPVAPSACLLVKSVLDEIGPFDETFSHVEDRELWSRLVRRYDIQHVDAMVCLYRKHAMQLTGDRQAWGQQSDRQMCRFFSALPLEEWFPEAKSDAALAQSIDQLVQVLLKCTPLPHRSILLMLRLAQQKSFAAHREVFIRRLSGQGQAAPAPTAG